MLKSVSDFYSQHKKKVWIAAAAVVYTLVVFGAGRFSVAKKVQEKAKETVVAKTDTKADTKTSDNKTTDLDKDVDKHTKKIIIERKDGTKITKVDTNTSTHVVKKEVEIRYVDRVVTQVKEVEKKVEVTKTVEKALPNWTVSAKLGTTFNDFKVTPVAPYVSPFLLGVEVDRRIVGPVWLGAWGTTDLHLKSVSGGLSVGVQF